MATDIYLWHTTETEDLRRINFEEEIPIEGNTEINISSKGTKEKGTKGKGKTNKSPKMRKKRPLKILRKVKSQKVRTIDAS